MFETVRRSLATAGVAAVVAGAAACGRDTATVVAPQQSARAAATPTLCTLDEPDCAVAPIPLDTAASADTVPSEPTDTTTAPPPPPPPSDPTEVAADDTVFVDSIVIQDAVSEPTLDVIASLATTNVEVLEAPAAPKYECPPTLTTPDKPTLVAHWITHDGESAVKFFVTTYTKKAPLTGGEVEYLGEKVPTAIYAAPFHLGPTYSSDGRWKLTGPFTVRAMCRFRKVVTGCASC